MLLDIFIRINGDYPGASILMHSIKPLQTLCCVLCRGLAVRAIVCRPCAEAYINSRKSVVAPVLTFDIVRLLSTSLATIVTGGCVAS